jgi:RING finger protein 113A
MGATATLQIETAYENDAQTIYANQRAAREFKRKNPHDKTYMGQNAYGGYVEKQDSVYGNATNGLIRCVTHGLPIRSTCRMGPVRAPDYLRQSILWEYHPGLCKDYKETGYCVFGGE